MRYPLRYRVLRLLLAVLAVACADTARAQLSTSFQKVGTTGMVVLELPVVPRTAALGDSRAADATISAGALFNNPALLGFARRRHLVHAAHTAWLVDTQLQAAGYALRTGLGTFGVSVMQLDMGTMQGTVNTSTGFERTETFAAASTAFGLSYARQLTDRFSFGGTVRYATETIAGYDAEALVVDVGMLYYTGFRSLRLAGLLQNFGTDSRYVNDSFKMPITFRFGTAMEVIGEQDHAGRVTLSVEALHPNNAEERLHLAVEYAPLAMMSLRGGYKLGYDEEGASLGVGLQVPGRRALAVDFAYTAFGRLGHTLGFGLHAGF